MKKIKEEKIEVSSAEKLQILDILLASKLYVFSDTQERGRQPLSTTDIHSPPWYMHGGILMGRFTPNEANQWPKKIKQALRELDIPSMEESEFLEYKKNQSGKEGEPVQLSMEIYPVVFSVNKMGLGLQITTYVDGYSYRNFYDRLAQAKQSLEKSKVEGRN